MDFDDSFDDARHRHLILLTRCCQLSQAGPWIGFIETGFIQDDWNGLEIAGGGVIDCLFGDGLLLCDLLAFAVFVDGDAPR
jgi:hypothetical protein